MATVLSIKEAQARLPELIADLKPGEELTITQNEQPVARLIGATPAVRKPRQPGSAKGILTIISEDDEHLEDFKEYMP